jgi:hypothetical protein
MKKLKHYLLTVLEKAILSFEFIWATWFALFLILLSIFLFYLYTLEEKIEYLGGGGFSLICGIIYTISYWKDYLKKYNKNN